MTKACKTCILKNTYTKLLREIKKDLNKYRDTPCSWIRTFNVKMSVLPKLMYRFKVISIKISEGCL